MALITLPTEMMFPDPQRTPIHVTTGFPLFSTSTNFTLNTTNTKLGCRFAVEKSGTVTHIVFRTRTVTTAQTIRAGIYTIGTDGNPTTTQYGGSAYGTQTSPAANTIYEVALGTNCTFTKGDVIGMVLEFDSTAGDVGICVLNTGVTTNSVVVRNTTSWQTAAANPMICGFKFDDGSYWGPMPIVDSAQQRTFNQTTGTADEYGIKIDMPFDASVCGLWFRGQPATGTDQYDFVLYEGTTERRASTRDGDAIITIASGAISLALFSSSYEVAAGTTYYASVRPNSSTSWVWNALTTTSSGYRETFPGGSIISGARRLDLGSWLTDIPNELPPIGLLIDKISDGAGGGGGGGGAWGFYG